MTAKDSVDIAGQIASSQFAGFIILMLVVMALGMVLRAMWGFVRGQIDEMKGALAACRKDHADCQRDNRMLANAIVAQADGKKWEAKTRAELVLSSEPTPDELPHV